MRERNISEEGFEVFLLKKSIYCLKDLKRHHLMVPAAQGALDFHILYQPLLLGEKKVLVSGWG